MSLLIEYIIAIITGVFLFLTLKGKIKSGGLFSGYILLTLLPAILMFVVPMWIFSTIGIILAGFEDKGNVLPVFLIGTEIIVLTAFILFKINKSPVHADSKAAGTDKKAKMLYSGRRLLHYAIYANILYTILAVVLVIIADEYYGNSIGYTIMHPFSSLVEVIMIIIVSVFIPLVGIIFIAVSVITAIIGIIAITGLAIMFSVVYIMSLNASIRMLYASKTIRRKRLLSVIFLIFPIINLFCMFRLCGSAKAELKQSTGENGFSSAI